MPVSRIGSPSRRRIQNQTHPTCSPPTGTSRVYTPQPVGPFGGTYASVCNRRCGKKRAISSPYMRYEPCGGGSLAVTKSALCLWLHWLRSRRAARLPSIVCAGPGSVPECLIRCLLRLKISYRKDCFHHGNSRNCSVNRSGRTYRSDRKSLHDLRRVRSRRPGSLS